MRVLGIGAEYAPAVVLQELAFGFSNPFFMQYF